MREINVSGWTGGVHLIVLALVDSEIYLHDLNDKYDGQDDGCRGDTGQIRGGVPVVLGLVRVDGAVHVGVQHVLWRKRKEKA